MGGFDDMPLFSSAAAEGAVYGMKKSRRGSGIFAGF
jgi:hypothetical protein